MTARRAVLADAVDRLVGAAESLGAVPVADDARALAAIVGAQARVVEALARLDTAQDRRRTGRVQRDLLRARLAALPGVSRDARGMVVVLPPEDDPKALPDEDLHRRIERLAAAARTEAAQEVAALGGDLPALAHAGLRVLLARAQEGDEAAMIALSPVIDAARGRPVVVLPALETGSPR